MSRISRVGVNPGSRARESVRCGPNASQFKQEGNTM